MKVLEIRKQNASIILTIVPEEPPHGNESLTLATARNHSSLGVQHLLKTVKQLSKLKGDHFLDVKWANKKELKKLYMLANLLEVALKEKIVETERSVRRAEVKREASAQVSQESIDASLRKKRQAGKMKRRKKHGENQRKKETHLKFARGGREFAEAAEPDNLDSPNKARSWRKVAVDQDTPSAVSLVKPHPAAIQSSWKRSLLQSTTSGPHLTASILVDDTAADLTGKVVIILKHANRSESEDELGGSSVEEQEEVEIASRTTGSPQLHAKPSFFQKKTTGGGSMTKLGNKTGPKQLSKEELFDLLMQKSTSSAVEGTSPTPPEDSETSLNELSPDITLSHGTYWEHHEQKTSAAPPFDFMPPQNDYLLQGDLFEAELNRHLVSLIPNTPVRNLISHLIRILRMDCIEPTIQKACAKLISRTGLLMKLFSERENIKETSSLWKSYFWSPATVANMSVASSRKMGKPSDEVRVKGRLRPSLVSPTGGLFWELV